MSGRLQPCGTNAAYYRHRRNGQVPCTACTSAHSDDTARRKRGYAYAAAERRLLGADLRERIAAVEQRLLEADLRELIALVAAAFTTPPDKSGEMT